MTDQTQDSPPFRDQSRYDDRGYWFEQFIGMLADKDDYQVDATHLRRHEYLFRFATRDNQPLSRSAFDDKPSNKVFRYVRTPTPDSKMDDFVRVQSAHDQRYARVSGEPGGAVDLFVITRVRARETSYPFGAMVGPYMEFDRAEQIKRLGSEDPEKMLRLTESHLHSISQYILDLGGLITVSQDVEKIVELLHSLHRASRSYRDKTDTLNFDLDTGKVWR